MQQLQVQQQQEVLVLPCDAASSGCQWQQVPYVMLPLQEILGGQAD